MLPGCWAREWVRLATTGRWHHPHAEQLPPERCLPKGIHRREVTPEHRVSSVGLRCCSMRGRAPAECAPGPRLHPQHNKAKKQNPGAPDSNAALLLEDSAMKTSPSISLVCPCPLLSLRHSVAFKVLVLAIQDTNLPFTATAQARRRHWGMGEVRKALSPKARSNQNSLALVQSPRIQTPITTQLLHSLRFYQGLTGHGISPSKP